MSTEIFKTHLIWEASIMKVNLRNFRLSLLFTLAVLSILSATASAQNKAEAKEKTRSFCSYNSYSNGDHVSVSDTRETTIPAHIVHLMMTAVAVVEREFGIHGFGSAKPMPRRQRHESLCAGELARQPEIETFDVALAA